MNFCRLKVYAEIFSHTISMTIKCFLKEIEKILLDLVTSYS